MEFRSSSEIDVSGITGKDRQVNDVQDFVWATLSMLVLFTVVGNNDTVKGLEKVMSKTLKIKVLDSNEISIYIYEYCLRNKWEKWSKHLFNKLNIYMCYVYVCDIYYIYNIFYAPVLYIYILFVRYYYI